MNKLLLMLCIPMLLCSAEPEQILKDNSDNPYKIELRTIFVQDWNAVKRQLIMEDRGTLGMKDGFVYFYGRTDSGSVVVVKIKVEQIDRRLALEYFEKPIGHVPAQPPGNQDFSAWIKGMELQKY